MSWPNHGYTGAVLPRPSIRSIRPLDRCCSTAYSSAMRTGSLVVISVVAVDTISLLVVAAMNDSRVVGADEKKGGLWCSPMANTSSPTSSVFCAIRTMASIRSASLGVAPDTGSRVTSLTENTPNCMQSPSRPPAPALDVHAPVRAKFMRLHIAQRRRRHYSAVHLHPARPSPARRFGLDEEVDLEAWVDLAHLRAPPVEDDPGTGSGSCAEETLVDRIAGLLGRLTGDVDDQLGQGAVGGMGHEVPVPVEAGGWGRPFGEDPHRFLGVGAWQQQDDVGDGSQGGVHSREERRVL